MSKIYHVVYSQLYKYSDNVKKFLYTVYCQSPATYRSLQKEFKLPCKSTLNGWFKQNVLNYQMDLTNINDVTKILIQNQPDERTKCTLVVDAFSVSTITPFNKINLLIEKIITVFCT